MIPRLQHQLDWIFTQYPGCGKSSIAFPFDFFSVEFLYFALAFGALHAPSGFDLGQKEIEN